MTLNVPSCSAQAVCEQLVPSAWEEGLSRAIGFDRPQESLASVAHQGVRPLPHLRASGDGLVHPPAQSRVRAACSWLGLAGF